MRNSRAWVSRAKRLCSAANACLLLAFTAPAQVHAAGAFSVVPAEFHGAWVPSNAACDSPLRVQVSGDKLTLSNGKDSQTLGGIEMAGPAYFQPGYRGIMAVLFTEFSGHQPVIATFNPDEKKGAARLEIARASPGQGAQLKVYNAHISKLNLAKRFPLDQVILKKCA